MRAQIKGAERERETASICKAMNIQTNFLSLNLHGPLFRLLLYLRLYFRNIAEAVDHENYACSFKPS